MNGSMEYGGVRYGIWKKGCDCFFGVELEADTLEKESARFVMSSVEYEYGGMGV